MLGFTSKRSTATSTLRGAKRLSIATRRIFAPMRDSANGVGNRPVGDLDGDGEATFLRKIFAHPRSYRNPTSSGALSAAGSLTVEYLYDVAFYGGVSRSRMPRLKL